MRILKHSMTPLGAVVAGSLAGDHLRVEVGAELALQSGPQVGQGGALAML